MTRSSDTSVAVVAESSSKPLESSRGRRVSVGLVVAILWIGLMVFVALFADLLPIDDPLALDTSRILDSPTSRNWFGTDGIGRDVFSRVIYGARVSLIVGLLSALVGMTVGITVGMTAGFFRGLLERTSMATIDIMLAFPNLVLLLALVAFIGRGFVIIAVTVGFLSVPIYARVSRASTLATSQREFVLAAKALGAPIHRILTREVLPNVLPPVLAWAFIAMALVIVLEGSLAFLGLGVPPPTPTWGGMIADGKAVLARGGAHLVLFPSLFMFLTVLAFNFIGDTLRRRLDRRESAT